MFKTGNFYFQNNKATTYHDNATGGGISAGGAIKFSDANIISFTNNTGTRLGGAVYAGSLEMSAKSITFTGNKAAASGYTNGQGGAIYCTGSVTFSGENVVAEFNITAPQMLETIFICPVLAGLHSRITERIPSTAVFI